MSADTGSNRQNDDYGQYSYTYFFICVFPPLHSLRSDTNIARAFFFCIYHSFRVYFVLRSLVITKYMCAEEPERKMTAKSADLFLVAVAK